VVRCIAKFYECRAGRPIGLCDSHHELLVSKGPTWFLLDTVPRHLHDRFILPHAYFHFRELAVQSLPVRADASRHLPRGFFPLRDIRLASPLTMRFPPRIYRSALSVSHALGGLLLAKHCGLISSHCHVQGLPSRGFPRRQADETHRFAFSPLLLFGCLLLQAGEPSCARLSACNFRGLFRAAIRSRMQRG
jgi:hypothetical protein